MMLTRSRKEKRELERKASLMKGKMGLVNTIRKYTSINDPEQSFFKLMDKRTLVCLFSDLTFKMIVRKKCMEVSPQSLYYISPVVHKYFHDDQELMALVRKVRNYNRHKKAYKKRVLYELTKTKLCKDEIYVVMLYI